jgi:putative sugar O-methyltransferase
MVGICENELWKIINRELVGDFTENDLKSFRHPKCAFNARIATWGPYDNTYRYFKTLLFNSALRMPKEFFALYKMVPNTDIGNPLFVTVSGLKINIEYLFSIEEILFLGSIMSQIETCVEIGGGYGRLCHAVIALFPNISKYTMIDLEPMQKVSKMYLKKALSNDQFKKINFVKVNELDQLGCFDLAININSFAEIKKEYVKKYLDVINEKSSFFYSRNTVGKYSPGDIGLFEYDKKQVKSALKSGMCQDKVDIFDEDALISARDNYLRSYLPGKKWTIFKDEISYPYTYYHHVLYSIEGLTLKSQ